MKTWIVCVEMSDEFGGGEKHFGPFTKREADVLALKVSDILSGACESAEAIDLGDANDMISWAHAVAEGEDQEEDEE